ncbi:MAG: protein phosphatase CheZ [Deltaproteobacteria bacterium]|jgi:chemotaxis regulatin CheY-phosphate phosphatase CheZ|nr:protein phosphatase CheZ [Deltaproteobacteria bacterium]
MTVNPPVIGFELGVGEFRIVTPSAIYNIRVIPELIKANTDLGVLSPLAGQRPASLPPPPPVSPSPLPQVNGLVPEQTFFQEISQELFDRVGQLARQLSVSVTEIPEGAPSLTQTGADLEDAKGQLEEVVEITEKASMTIMDLADQIQDDMETLNGQMGVLTNLESLLEKDDEPVPAKKADPSVESAFLEAFNELKAAVDRLAGASLAAGEPTPPPAAASEQEPSPSEPPPATTTKMVPTFDLGGLFQTLYEFCANEQVKDHIKTMRAASETGGFQSEAILSSLTELAETLEADDGFYNLPIPAILKILYNNTENEDNKNTLRKMNQTTGSIFLDANLPVEAQMKAVTVAAEPVFPPPPEPPKEAAEPQEASPADGEPELANLKSLVERLETALPDLLRSGGEAFVAIPKGDRDVIVSAVAASDSLIKNTTRHLTRIMEALSFQDLSGQRIKKIVNLISDIQVQLLTLLVSVDSKIKAHKDSPAKARPKEETDKVAQAEVDRMLEKLAGGPAVGEPSELKGPGADNRLDQGAVNDLLAELGF